MPLLPKPRWLVCYCSALLAGLLFSLTLEPGSIPPPACIAVNLALFVCLTCYLLLPLANNPVDLLINCGACTVLFILLSQLPVAADIPATILLQVCVIIICLSMTLGSLTLLIEKLFPRRKNIPIIIFLSTAIITTSPVWLGPVVDIYQLNNTIINSVVSITPLTHFSVAAEYDYLRSEWLYQNTAFGSLPFNYPRLTSIATYYFLFVLSLQIILWRVTRHTRVLNQSSRSKLGTH